MSATYATEEMMAVAVSRVLADGDLVFIGVGTSGRAFTLAVGIPLVACQLARADHAPDLDVFWGNLLSPDLTRQVGPLRQDEITRWPGAAAPISTDYKVDALTRGRFDVSFEAAAQVDRFGNLNITWIDGAGGPVRLVGSLAQAEHLRFVKRPIVIADLNSRTFVESVDYVTSAGGFREDGTHTPHCVVTDVGILSWRSGTDTFELTAGYPDVNVEQALEALDGLVSPSPDLEILEPPTDDQIRRIRNEFDPNGSLLGNRRPGRDRDARSGRP